MNDGENRFEIVAEAYDEPVVYYGKGYESASNDENKVLYTQTLLQVTPRWYHKIAENWFLGIGGNINYTGTRDPELGDDVLVGNPLLFDDLNRIPHLVCWVLCCMTLVTSLRTQKVAPCCKLISALTTAI
ncbi:hypothetical protein JCM19236_866 [Vibrio sp. JCM 19236]|nr:hypothetical protein JCM19236_866 [Vibrio sp. JCM 19236]